MNDLEELERRVTEKWVAAAAKRAPEWELPDLWAFDFSNWLAHPPALPNNWPQFPREQWLVYPEKRRVTLLICDKALDQDLSDEEWIHVCLLMQYGGKERAA